MSDRRDLYDVLGVSKNASPDDIKKAFRKMAKEYHPDLHPNDKQAEEKFKEVNEAYDILSDPSKRERYDRFGFAGIDPSHGMDGASANGFDFDDMFGFGDIFSSFFGGGRGGRGGRASRQAQRYGTNIEMPLVLEFEEAVFGVEKDISVKRRVPCHECNGTGAEAGSKPETCPTCQGRGEVVRSSRTAFGILQQVSPCSNCSGNGQIIKKKCSTCRGTGVVSDIDKIHIKVPPGLPDEGVVIPLEGKGNMEASGSIPGDLRLVVEIKNHPVFKRDGKHLMREIFVDYLQLVMGDEVQVMTLEGTPVKVRIPPGTKPGDLLRLEGKGVPVFRDNRGRRGDLYITVNIEIPKMKDLPGEEKKLVEDLAKMRLERQRKAFAANEEKVKESLLKHRPAQEQR